MESGKILRNLREKEKLTQKEAAKLLKVTRSHLTKVETGNLNAGIRLLSKASEVFKVPLAYFFLEPSVTKGHERKGDENDD